MGEAPFTRAMDERDMRIWAEATVAARPANQSWSNIIGNWPSKPAEMSDAEWENWKRYAVDR